MSSIAGWFFALDRGCLDVNELYYDQYEEVMAFASGISERHTDTPRAKEGGVKGHSDGLRNMFPEAFK